MTPFPRESCLLRTLTKGAAARLGHAASAGEKGTQVQGWVVVDTAYTQPSKQRLPLQAAAESAQR